MEMHADASSSFLWHNRLRAADMSIVNAADRDDVSWSQRSVLYAANLDIELMVEGNREESCGCTGRGRVGAEITWLTICADLGYASGAADTSRPGLRAIAAITAGH